MYSLFVSIFNMGGKFYEKIVQEIVLTYNSDIVMPLYTKCMCCG